MNKPLDLKELMVDQAELAKRLRQETSGEVMTDSASRGRYATDASIYQAMPVAVFVPKTAQDIASAIQIAAELGVPVLPRTPFLIMRPGNKYSKAEANKMLDGLTKEQILDYNKEGKQFIIHDYLVVPSYGILGYLPKDSEQAKFISEFKKREPISNSTAKEYFDLN